MSVAKSKEEEHQAERQAKEFQKMLEEEIAHIDSIMKPTIETLIGVKPTLAMMKPEKVRETIMGIIKKAGLLILKFDTLTESHKISLFDKLMKWVEKLKSLLEEYGKKVGVDSFSIQVGFPWGVSVSFTFKTKS